jgi:uncharacterized protein (TIGR03437 family)
VNHRTIAVIALGLLPAGNIFSFAAAGLAPQPKQQQITPSPAGPFHVAVNQLLDSHGRPFLMRGTQLPGFHLQTVDRDNQAGDVFGAHSATSLSAIRLRFNLNTVRLPLNVRESDAPNYFPELARVVRRANEIDLLVILAADEPGAHLPTAKTVAFWSRCAAYFKDYPNVVFDVFSDPSPATLANAHSNVGWQTWRDSLQPAVRAIRDAGATQPIAAMAWKDDRLFEGADPSQLLSDSNVIYEASPRYTGTRTDEQRTAQFGQLATYVPMLATGWDLELDNPTACAAIPHDPSAAAALVQGNLDYFDAHRISWTVSTFEPGKLVKDLSYHDATTLENGWTCGSQSSAGLGRVIEGHMRASEERGLFVVSGSGGPDVARGAISLAYGPILAAFDAKASGRTTPISLGRISIQVTDSKGVTRPAGMLWASAGWGQANYVVPIESATGPAVMTLVREDGSRASSNITIGDTAPGFLTGHSCRGPAVGSVVATAAPISFCKNSHCETLPIAMKSDGPTRVRIQVSGYRFARSLHDIEVTIGGIAVPVVAYGASADPGYDYLTIDIPAALHGMGETDVVSHLYGRPSNAVRLNLGNAPLAKTNP